MSKTNTYIELNGKTYDAKTGSILGQAVVETVKQSVAKVASSRPGQVLDGIVHRAGVSQMATVAKLSTTRVKPRLAHKARATGRKTQHSSTLMRQAVRKPILNGLFNAKATPLASRGDVTPSSKRNVWTGLKADRFSHSQAITKSGRISKFGSGRIVAKLAPLPVAEPPHHKSQASKHVAKQSPQSNLVNAALASATSHQQPKLKKTRLHHRVAKRLHIKPKLLNIFAASLAALLIGGFWLSQNLPGLTVRMAAARAGFHATLPAYQPAGFALRGPIQYAPGVLTLNFQSNSDTRNFQVKQQASSWNSETLLQTYVAKNNQPYQTYEDNGRTVYISDNGASLVTDNKWVQVMSDGSLSTEQLLNIVKSIH